MFSRRGLWYVSLAVAAYMVGISNLWKFPTLILEYGLSGLLSYTLMTTLMIPLIATAMTSTKSKRYELVRFYSREFNRVGPAITFFLFDTILLIYYPIAGGWFLRELTPSNLPLLDVWNIVALLLFFTLLITALRRGGNHTMDAMIISLAIAFAGLILASWGLYSRIETMGAKSVFKDQLFQVLSWKEVNSGMLVETAKQATYSVGIGMGFYLLLGSFLSERISPIKVAIIGVIIDATAGLISALLMIMAISISPSSGMEGRIVITSTLPEILRAVNMTTVLYVLYLAFFFAALSSMIPLGEVVTRVLMELSRKPPSPRRLPEFRKRSVLLMMSLALLLGLSAIAIEEYTGLDAINTLDTAVETFILFGAILEVPAVLYNRDYIPRGLKISSYPGVVSVLLTGTLAVWSMVADQQFIPLLILLGVFGLAILPGKFWQRRLGT
ncbi:sodium-dependent transporter [Thermococcus sp.]